MRVLLIEDDSVLGWAIRDHVATSGNRVDWRQTIADAQSSLETTAYELILLDLGLPDGDGLAFLRGLRASGNKVPVIIVTAQAQVAIRIEGLNAGADDYLVKPFDLAELTARLAAVLRRHIGEPNPTVQVGDVSIDLAARMAAKAGRPVQLTAREWAVLARLLQRRGAMVQKSDLEDSVYEFDAGVESNAVEVHVSRIRKKLGHDLIRTIRGVGYQVAR